MLRLCKSLFEIKLSRKFKSIESQTAKLSASYKENVVAIFKSLDVIF